MPGLKDYIKSDLNTFINIEEFATKDHTVNGEEMYLVLDEDLLKERQQGNYNEPSGIFIADLLFHVKKEEFGEKPAVGQRIYFDGKPYEVAEAEENAGLYTIALSGRFS